MIYHWLRQYRLNKQLIGIDRVLSFKVPTLDHWNHPRDTRDTATDLQSTYANTFEMNSNYTVLELFFILFSYFTIVSASMDYPFLFYCVFSLPSATWVTWFPGSHQLSGWQPRRPGLDSSSATATAMVKSRNGFGWTNRTQTEAKQKQST